MNFAEKRSNSIKIVWKICLPFRELIITQIMIVLSSKAGLVQANKKISSQVQLLCLVQSTIIVSRILYGHSFADSWRIGREITREMPQFRTSRFEYSQILRILSTFGGLPLTHSLPFARPRVSFSNG